MAVNAEVLVRLHLNEDVTLPAAFMDVPKDRPAEFITVERTGGDRVDVRDRPVIAIQCWSTSRYQASELARKVGDSLEAMRTHPNVGRMDINTSYNFPDLDSGTPRYQVVVELVTVD